MSEGHDKMKTNLKNFPQVPLCTSTKDRINCVVSFLRWKKDFEAELREEEQVLEEWLECDPGNMLNRLCLEGKLTKIKEILGEET